MKFVDAIADDNFARDDKTNSTTDQDPTTSQNPHPNLAKERRDKDGAPGSMHTYFDPTDSLPYMAGPSG